MCLAFQEVFTYLGYVTEKLAIDEKVNSFYPMLGGLNFAFYTHFMGNICSILFIVVQVFILLY